MTRPIFAHVPYPMLRENLDYVLGRRVNPEVFFAAEVLDALIPEELAAISNTLAAHDIPATIHAPFMDLNPGSFEPLLRQATEHRLDQVLTAASILRPVNIVVHPGFDRWRYGDTQARWLDLSLQTWRWVADRAAEIGCTVAVENIFDEEPAIIRTLIETIGSPFFRHCFDVGHWHLFSRVGLEEWFAELGECIAEVHIHDNLGSKDDHLPVGCGQIDFPRVFNLLERYAPTATWTIEAHCKDTLEVALRNIAPYQATAVGVTT